MMQFMEAQPTATPAVTVTATDWPGFGYLAGHYTPVSIPGTADLLVDGTQVTVALWLDDGTPYVADAPEWLTIAQCEAIDVAVAAAWDERCADEAAESYDTGRGWREAV